MNNIQLKKYLILAFVCITSFSCITGVRSVLDPDSPRPGENILSIRWRRILVTDLPEVNTRIIPLETSVAALDVPNGRIFVGSSSTGVVSLRASDGHMFWRHDVDGSVSSSLLYDPETDRVFTGSDNGFMYCMNARSGRILWRTQIMAEVVNEPVLTVEAVYITAADGTVAALNRKNGRIIWSFKREPPAGFTSFGHPGAVIEDRKLVTGFATGEIMVLDAIDGSVIWQRDLAEDVSLVNPGSGNAPLLDVDTTPVVDGETVYVSSLAGGLYALDLLDGSVKWRRPDIEKVTGLALDSGILFVSRTPMGISAVDARDGSILWNRRFSSGVLTTPVVHGDILLVADSEGGLYVVRQGDGELLQQIKTGDGFSSPPSVSGSRAFILSNGGTLLSLYIN